MQLEAAARRTRQVKEKIAGGVKKVPGFSGPGTVIFGCLKWESNPHYAVVTKYRCPIVSLPLPNRLAEACKT